MRRTLPAVVLVRPQEDGNLGSVARAMANMGLSRLLLVTPTADPSSPAARAMAVGARPILEAATVSASLEEALEPFGRVVGTTSQRDRLLAERPLAPRELPGALAADPPDTPTALVFGPEASGLTADELALCAPLISVPCTAAMPTLNLAQAVLIVAYELMLARLSAVETPTPSAEAIDPEHRSAPHGELQELFRQAEPLLAAVGFARDSTFQGVLRDLRALAGRASPTEREVRILRGIARRAARSLGTSVSGDKVGASSAAPAGAADPREETR